ncbi:hypothetical protein ACIQ57_16175 [Lysinibacillus xylanilyticus]|uniref:hypothetical protein n=1 Tax=Lysinibacillus xylanilyticus TaxID=582475 RepID=UPI003804E26C
MFSVAKAKRQLQMFSVAKAKRQLQMFSARKRSDSGNYAKAKSISLKFRHTLKVFLLSILPKLKYFVLICYSRF